MIATNESWNIFDCIRSCLSHPSWWVLEQLDSMVIRVVRSQNEAYAVNPRTQTIVLFATQVLQVKREYDIIPWIYRGDLIPKAFLV